MIDKEDTSKLYFDEPKNNPNICNICFSENLIEENCFSSSCGHIFCKECYYQYIISSIASGPTVVFTVFILF